MKENEVFENDDLDVLRTMVEENAVMAEALVTAQKNIAQKNRQLEAQKPMVNYAQAVMGSGESILIGDLAKLITQNGVKIGQHRLFQWMRDHNYLFKNKRRPIQKWVEKGLFEMQVSGVKTVKGVMGDVTTKVTVKGQEYFLKGFVSGKFY